MKIGRNDPCPCGSGKKYKKCCLQGDLAADARRNNEQREKAALAAEQEEPFQRPAVSPTKPATRPPVAPDPHIEAFDARWNEFKQQDYEGRISLFLATLAEDESIDDELAFEMLSQLHQAARQHGEQQRFHDLITLLRQRLPKVFAESASYYLEWLIADVLNDGCRADLPELVRELAANADDDFETLHRVITRLEYHGELALLREIAGLGWVKVKDSEDVLPWAKNEFAINAAYYELFDYMLHADNPRRDDPQFLDRLTPYADEAQAATFVALLDDILGKSRLAGSLSSLEEAAPTEDDNPSPGEQSEKTRRELDQREVKLIHLTAEFLGYLYREHKIPHTRAYRARQELVEYLVQRDTGNLDPDWRRPARRKRPSRSSGHEIALCPDRKSLDYYLTGLLDFMNLQLHAAVALFGALPAWLRFLEERQLLNPQEREQAMKQLQPLHADLLKAFEPNWAQEEPVLMRDLKAWPGGSEKESKREPATAT